MASMTAALRGAPSAVVASTSTAACAKLGAPSLVKLSCNKRPFEWANKTVSNGSRVNAFNVVNPDNNFRYETLSYLPPLTDEQIVKQVDYLLRNGWIPAIEFDKSAALTRTESKIPGYYEGRYWSMWKLPLFGATDSGQVLQEVQEAKKLYPNSFIRVIGFDNVKQVQVVSFVVVKPQV